MSQQVMSPQAEMVEVADAAHPRGSRRRVTRWVVRGLLILLLLFLGYKLVRVGIYAYAGYQGGQELLSLRGKGRFVSADLLRAQTGMTAIAQAATGIEDELRFTFPALRAAQGLPWIGPTLAALPALVTTGREAILLGQGMVDALVDETSAETPRDITTLAIASLVHQADEFVALSAHAAAMQTALAQIDAPMLLTSLAQPVAQAQAGTTLLRVGLELAPVLPTLLGFGEPQSYLLLVQNNQEVRATGGFISAVGTVTVVDGRPQELDLTDSYNIVRSDVDHPAAPDPMRRYMDIELIFLRDANWSPDFPTTAQLARSLYLQDSGALDDGKDIAGVISIDLRAVELLIHALGPIPVPGTDEPITGDNLIRRLQEFWDQPLGTEDTIDTARAEWWEQRKDFMPIIAKAALARIETGDFDPLALAAALRAALDERAIQVWMTDATVAELLNAQRWDGALAPQPGADFLALVDTNMGYNKVDAVITRSLDYQVRWPDGAGAPAQATLAVTYRHPVRAEGVECVAKSEYGLNYTDMIERCYFNYVRLYVPAGSELVSINGVTEDSVVSRAGERGTQVFAGYFVVQPGYQHSVTFTYRLPAALTPGSYRLVAQRQSGVGALPLSVRVGGAAASLTLDNAYLTWSPGLVDVGTAP